MTRNSILTLIFAAFISLGLPHSSFAANCTVTNSNDSGGGSLRDCIDNVATNDGDVITIDPAVTSPIGLTSGSLNHFASISINGAGPAVSIIDGSGNGGNRIFTIDNIVVQDKTVNISGVTLRNATTVGNGAAIVLVDNVLNLSNCEINNNTSNGPDSDGGAIYMDFGSSLSIDSCQFNNNQALGMFLGMFSDGGAIFNEGGTLFINNSGFFQNSAAHAGGAIYLDSLSIAQIRNSTFEENTAGADANGGAINNEGLSLTVDNSTFHKNMAPGPNAAGGGINHNSGQLFLSNSDFTENTTVAGGGLYSNSDSLIDNIFVSMNSGTNDEGGGIVFAGDSIIRNSTIANNSMTDGGLGGGITVGQGSTLMENCTVADNQVASMGGPGLAQGGGIHVRSSASAEILNSTIFSNEAVGEGGGIFVEGTVVLNNVTVAGNSSDLDGGGIHVSLFGTGLFFSNSILSGNTAMGIGPDCINNDIMNSIGTNLIENPSGCILTSGTAIGGNPMLASALANNGGPGIGVDGANPTLTLALGAGSAALEMGDNTTCEPTDQRGTTRPQGADCDLGSYEAGPSADLSAMSLSFTQQEVGTTSAAQSITLTNNGPIPLTINNITIGGMDAGDFASSNDCGGSVAPGGSCNISGTFTPTTTGVRQAEITVDTSANVQVILLLGFGFVTTVGGGCSLASGASSNLLGIILLSLSLLGLLAFRWRARIMKHPFLAVFPLATFLFLASIQTSQAADCTVTSGGDSIGPTTAGELRDCIDVVATSDGDTVTINPGLTVNLTEGIITINDGINIVGGGMGSSIIDGSGNVPSRIFNINSGGNNKQVNISDLTLQNSHSDSPGGAINLFLTDTLILIRVDLNNNESDVQGGAINSDGILLVFDSNFSLNISDGSGGAIYLNDGSCQIHNSNFEDNTADSEGGAIHNASGGDLQIDNSTIDNNTSTNGRGGGINHTGGGAMFLTNSDITNNDALNAASGGIQINTTSILENCLISGNTASGDDGGAIHSDSRFTIRNSTISNNTVTGGEGGGIYFHSGALIDNCTITQNRTLDDGGPSDDNGGGIFVDSDGVVIKNSTIFDNSSDDDGGGMGVGNGRTVQVNNSTIADNVAGGDGGGIFNDGVLSLLNSIIGGNSDNGGEPDCININIMQSLGTNLIQDPTGCILTSGAAIGGDPMLPAALANNGGPGIGVDGANPTLTLALGDGSAALEMGDNASCEPTDQRGTVRPQGTDCDLGAYEAGPSADLSAMTVTFPDQVVGTTSAAQTMTLTNNGPIPLTINNIAIGGVDAGDFAQSNDCGGSVAPGGGFCTISGTFTPTTTGLRQANVSVDTSANVQTIVLLGGGIIVTTSDGCSLNPLGFVTGSWGGLLLLGTSLGILLAVRRRK